LGKGALGEGGSLHPNKIHYLIIIWEWGAGIFLLYEGKKLKNTRMESISLIIVESESQVCENLESQVSN